jgi:hypothetical protein
VVKRPEAHIPAHALREGDVVRIGKAWHVLQAARPVGDSIRFTFTFFERDLPRARIITAELRQPRRDVSTPVPRNELGPNRVRPATQGIGRPMAR